MMCLLIGMGGGDVVLTEIREDQEYIKDSIEIVL